MSRAGLRRVTKKIERFGLVTKKVLRTRGSGTLICIREGSEMPQKCENGNEKKKKKGGRRLYSSAQTGRPLTRQRRAERSNLFLGGDMVDGRRTWDCSRRAHGDRAVVRLLHMEV